jgi:transcriptional regulator with GAF, ATPase, and Fis domain
MAAVDDPERAQLENRLRFEALVADLSSEFVNLQPALVDGAIVDALRRLVEALDVDRGVLTELSDDKNTLDFTHYWSRTSLEPIARSDANELYPFGLSVILTGAVHCFSSLSELPPDAPDRHALGRSGTQSAAVVPLMAAGRVIGSLGFTSTRDLRQQVSARAGSQAGATGRSPAIRQVLNQVAQVAPTSATVLLLGETGTGKELIATAIHDQSSRRAHTMVRVNCAAIPVALIESELFGREKGAYTGALARQAGRFELANGSTIFLDEIGELTADVQVKLLRVLQEKQIDRLGGSRSIDLDLRVIAATNRDLDQAVSDGTFREDLYYRLNVFAIRVPPLRERAEDIPTLVWAFVDEFSKTMGKRLESISKEHMAALQRYSWPGNIRELRNVVERAVIVSTGPRLAIEPPGARAGRRHGSTQLADVEREHIRSVLQRTGWRIRGHGGAAELLDLKPSTLEGRMEKLGLRRPQP